jgi:hypothetical protein
MRKYLTLSLVLAASLAAVPADAKDEKPPAKKERVTPYSNSEKAKERRSQRVREERKRKEQGGFYRWKKKDD